MDNITWRTSNVRGRHAKGDISINIAKHTGRRPMLSICLLSKFADSHDYRYVAISTFNAHSERIYFLLTEERRTLQQNKFVGKGRTRQALFTLKDGEDRYIEKWCGKKYELTKIDENIYFIERGVENE